MDSLPAIIVPAYKRSLSLFRLLTSINDAHYPNQEIRLVISLEGDAKEEVIECANTFSFKHGEKEIIRHSRNLGLREHIIWCGNQTSKYGSIILLEDDLYVDPYFYVFAKKALRFYSLDDQSSGIALYAPHRNEYTGLPFEPLFNGESTYPMQVPCSWGQAWTKGQWEKFLSWYENKSAKDIENCLSLPDHVKNWPESSWKKYFSAFLVECGQYFIYPYQSYTTNCADSQGTHIIVGSGAFQVPLPFPSRQYKDNYIFNKVEDSTILYDSFFEINSELVRKTIPFFSDKEFEVDLYCSKPIKLLQRKEYVVTTRNVNHPISTINISFRPIDLNLFGPNNRDSFLQAHVAKSLDIANQDKRVVELNLAKYFNDIDLYENLNKKMEKIRNSCSWKITKPLRSLRNFFSAE